MGDRPGDGAVAAEHRRGCGGADQALACPPLERRAEQLAERLLERPDEAFARSSVQAKIVESLVKLGGGKRLRPGLKLEGFGPVIPRSAELTGRKGGARAE